MKIKLTEDQARDFEWGDLIGFIYVDHIEDAESIYKERMQVETICKQESTGKHFSLNWSKSISHFHGGEHEYPHTEIIEVKQIEVTKVTKEWKAV